MSINLDSSCAQNHDMNFSQYQSRSVYCEMETYVLGTLLFLRRPTSACQKNFDIMLQLCGGLSSSLVFQICNLTFIVLLKCQIAFFKQGFTNERYTVGEHWNEKEIIQDAFGAFSSSCWELRNAPRAGHATVCWRGKAMSWIFCSEEAFNAFYMWRIIFWHWSFLNGRNLFPFAMYPWTLTTGNPSSSVFVPVTACNRCYVAPNVCRKLRAALLRLARMEWESWCPGLENMSSLFMRNQTGFFDFLFLFTFRYFDREQNGTDLPTSNPLYH